MSTSAGQQRRTDAISPTDEEAVKQVLMESVLGLWDVVNGLTRLKPSRRDRYRVTIFGSARARPGTFGYEETKRVAAALAALGCDIITGGGPGLMQAANEGAAARGGRAQSMGIRVDLPFEQEVTLPDLSGTPRTLSDLEAIGNAAGAGFWARVQALGDKPYHQPPDLPGFPI